MDIVTLLNLFNCYSSIFPTFPNNEKRKNCFRQHVKFGIRTLIWMKMSKISSMEDLLATVIQFWTFSSKIESDPFTRNFTPFGWSG